MACAYDALGYPLATTDPRENTTVSVYDGASRQTQTHQHLREKGLGKNPPAANQTLLSYGGGAIDTLTVYDGNSRIQQLVDDNGNVTAYEYDSHDRETKMIYHDGSEDVKEYDLASDVVVRTDCNGSVFTNSFDPLGRKTSCSIVAAAGVEGTFAQDFKYDGLSRMTYSDDLRSP